MFVDVGIAVALDAATSAAAEGTMAAGTALGEGAMTAGSAIGDAAMSAGSAIGDAASAVGTGIGDAASSVGSGIGDAFGSVTGEAGSLSGEGASALPAGSGGGAGITGGLTGGGGTGVGGMGGVGGLGTSGSIGGASGSAGLSGFGAGTLDASAAGAGTGSATLGTGSGVGGLAGGSTAFGNGIGVGAGSLEGGLTGGTLGGAGGAGGAGGLGASTASGGTMNAPGMLEKGMNYIAAHPAASMIVGGTALSALSRPSAGIAPVSGPSGPPKNFLASNFQRTAPEQNKRIPNITTASQGYADGGLLSSLPSASPLKDVYNSSIGGAIAPQLGSDLFGGGKPTEDNTESEKPQVVNNYYAAGLQHAAQQQQQTPNISTPVQNYAGGGSVHPSETSMNSSIEDATAKRKSLMGHLEAIRNKNAYQVDKHMNQQPTHLLPQEPVRQTQSIETAASGGIMGYSLGGYADSGNPRLLKGPGSGISDDIPAYIGEGDKEPARLARGEFVVPARAVSELGSGSTDAGGEILQQMVDRIQARRAKTTGKGKIAADSKSRKVIPA